MQFVHETTALYDVIGDSSVAWGRLLSWIHAAFEWWYYSHKFLTTEEIGRDFTDILELDVKWCNPSPNPLRRNARLLGPHSRNCL